MAKKIYKIPDSIDKSMGDMEIALQNADGIGVRPTPIKIILIYILSGLVGFLFIMKSFISDGGLFSMITFGILWGAMTVLLLKQDNTGLPQASLVITMLNYLPRNMRRIITRTSAKANDFYALTGISGIDGDKGLITFADGSYGYMYRVVGSASLLLFEDDRDAILDRVDNFYRKMKTDYEMIFITTRESQKIYKQVASLKYRYDNLEVDDPDLKAVADMEYRYLRDRVGGTYRSIHQYLIIKADNEEALLVGKNLLQSEVENSFMMFKQCTALFEDDIYDLFRTVYRGRESV